MANMRWADRIGRRLKLRDLHVLSAVVQWGSMAKAAQHLAVSQPVVSAAVADLEHAIGVRLLDRSRRGVEPTIYGRALLKHGMVAFDALKQGVKEIEFLADPTAGELRIGCPEWISAGLLPVIIDRMLQKHPRIVFHVDQTITAHAGFSRVARTKPGRCDGLDSDAVDGRRPACRNPLSGPVVCRCRSAQPVVPSPKNRNSLNWSMKSWQLSTLNALQLPSRFGQVE